MNEIDELVAWVCARGPAPLPLEGWDQASIWGWDETASGLFAELRRNTDDPDKPPIRIGPGDFTPVITLPETLAQYIAMAANRDPWEVIAAMDEACDQDDENEDWDDEEDDAEADGTGTIVTMTEGYDIWW